MVTLKEIRTLLAAREYEMLRELHSRAGVEGIESCDEGQLYYDEHTQCRGGDCSSAA